MHGWLFSFIFYRLLNKISSKGNEIKFFKRIDKTFFNNKIKNNFKTKGACQNELCSCGPDSPGCCQCLEACTNGCQCAAPTIDKCLDVCFPKRVIKNLF